LILLTFLVTQIIHKIPTALFLLRFSFTVTQNVTQNCDY